MPTIKPNHVSSTLRAATRDGVVSDKEAAAFTRAALKDLVHSDDGATTLKMAAENLRRFLEPFRERDSQEEGGVQLGRSTRYSLADVADKLAKAADELATLNMNAFQVAMALSIDDGKITAYEAKDLGRLAQKTVDSADDPAEAARTMRRVLLELETLFAQTAALGFGGPMRDEVLTATSSRELARLNAFLGHAIAQGLGAAGASETVAPDSAFAKGVADIAHADHMERRMLLETLPHLVDQELGMYDATGLTGPAKLKMEQQAEARGRALLAHVNDLAAGGDVEDLQQALYRIVTGRFLPDDAMAELSAMVKTLPVEELEQGIAQFKRRVQELGGAQSFSVKNEKKGLLEGVALLEAELARRASDAVPSDD